ncbi:MAG: hypothetical protein JF614_27120, partial [Acidobacteria bacterium]|nr:hypothetical protein [Acidobacteriota bacterium]
RNEAIKILRDLPAEELRENVVKPHFTALGGHVVEEGESDFYDLLLSSKTVGEQFLTAVRLLTGEGRDSEDFIRNQIQRIVTATFDHPYGSSRVPLHRYYWITTGTIRGRDRRAIQELLDQPKSTGCPVDVWDAEELYTQLLKHDTLRHIGPLGIVFARSQIRYHAKKRGVFAAHWSYRALRLYARQRPLRVEQARECLAQGISALRADPLRHLYYHRVLAKVLEMWEVVLQQGQQLEMLSQDRLLFEVLAAGDVRRLLQETHPELSGFLWLLEDYEPVFQQMEQLEQFYTDGPAEASTLDFCRLLLRFGFPPTEPRIKSRLERVPDEIRQEKNENCSVDGQCSLCTGAVVSCFSLARRKPNFVKRAAAWLASLGKDRFSHLLPRYVQAPPANHSLHYAASVLQARLDYDPENREGRLRDVVEVFFVSPERESHGLYLEWLRYRNGDVFEIYSKILAAFLRYYLVGKTLIQAQEEFLAAAVADLIAGLENDSVNREVQQPYLLYAGRCNLSSFMLGCLLHVPEADRFACEVSKVLHARARMATQEGNTDLWDSSAERTAMFLRGYLDFWETVLFLAEQGRPIGPILPVEAAASLANLDS